MSKARVSSKGQLTIPAEVRRRLGLEKGDVVVFEPAPGSVVLRKAPSLDDLYGSVPLPNLKLPWKKVRDLAWRTRAERIVRSSATRTS